MSKKTKTIKTNKLLHNAKIVDKFKMSFSSIMIGSVVVGIIGIISVIITMLFSDSIIPPIIAIVLLIVATLLNLSMCTVVSKSLSSTIVSPVEELAIAVNKVKEGSFDINITYESTDELGELGKNLKETCNQLSLIVHDSGSLLNKMADGNFNVYSSNEAIYVGDFKTIITSIKKLTYELNSTIYKIKDASQYVMVGSEQLANNSQALALGATDQAAAIEELIATIENVANISEESAENAVTAATNAKSTATDAKKSREEFTNLTSAMERITETSKEIENIIATIEDIASQTNLLSLNASIEAARAGEAGKGFAVVADQIGKLADDSAKSAVSTRELISKSLDEIKIGNEIVENTVTSIDTVLTNMEVFASMASGAAEASRVQADMLKQLEAGIEQISSVVQNNAASAQETSTVSEELSAQSITLDEMLGKFSLQNHS